MQTRTSLLTLLTVGALCTVILIACAGGKLGYGVVLWSPDKSPVKTGQIVTVKSQSKINNSYAVEVSGSQNPVEVPTWRVKLFPNEKEAVNFSISYSPLAPLLAKATTNGAPIRDKPEATATRVYRLRQDQVVKVIAKQPNQVTIDGVNGHWYQVLTNDGVLGYSFDANLQIYNPATETQQQTSVAQLTLNKVISSTFRPQYFQQMIDSNRIDLKKFSPKYGFFTDTAAKTVSIEMPDYSLKFDYTDLKELAPNDYSFTGTPIEMRIQSPDEIRLLYSDSKGNRYDQVFVRIKQDIGFLVEKEKNRRLQVFSNFLDKAPFSSDYYGKIDLEPDMRFTWTGYSRLVPDIIPAGVGSTGIVDFPLYLGDSLQGEYDGVISFVFGAQPNVAKIQSNVSISGANTVSPGDNLAAVSSILPGKNAMNSSTGPAGVSTTEPNGSRQASAAPQPGQAPSTQPSTTADLSSHPTVNFLYSFADNGVKLTYVPQSTIDNDMVTSVSSTPIIIFFSFKATNG